MAFGRQLFIFPLAISALVCLLIGLGLMVLNSRMVDAFVEREDAAAAGEIGRALDAELRDALSRAETVANMSVVQEAVARRDDKMLEALFAGNFEYLKTRTGVAQFQFHIPPATSLIRIHSLKKRGDDLSAFRKTVVDANASGRSVMGFEIGRAGLGARGVAVVRHDGQSVGSVEIGLDLGRAFFQGLAASTGRVYDFHILPDPGAAEAADQTRLASFEGEPLLDAADLEAVASGRTVRKFDSRSGSRHAVTAVPVRDYAGRIAAVVAVATPMTVVSALGAIMLWGSLAAIAVGMLLASAISWVVSRRLVCMVSTLAASTVAIAESRTPPGISYRERADEIGEMSRALLVFQESLAENKRIQARLIEEEAARTALRAEQEAQTAREQEAVRAAEAEAAAARAEAAEQEAERRDAQHARDVAKMDEQARLMTALAEGLDHLARGNLTHSLDDPLPEDFEKLRQDFNGAVGQLAGALGQVTSDSHVIDAEIGAISSAAGQLSSRLERDAATLEETAAALEQLTASVSAAADGARSASRMAADAKVNAESGVEVVGRAVSAMSRIEESSNAISKITSVIDEIAFQTNLLALNAGVEAARAGEAGRGFAVVASEVRALAQRSSDAANEISNLISASGQQVKSGVDLVQMSGDALTRIVASVLKITEQVEMIATSAQEQAAGIGEINAAVAQLDQSAQANAAMLEELTAATGSTMHQSQKLIGAIEQFDLPAASAGGSDGKAPQRKVA